MKCKLKEGLATSRAIFVGTQIDAIGLVERMRPGNFDGMRLKRLGIGLLVIGVLLVIGLLVSSLVFGIGFVLLDIVFVLLLCGGKNFHVFGITKSPDASDNESGLVTLFIPLGLANALFENLE